MKIQKIVPAILLAIVMTSVMSVWAPQAVQAQCGLPGQPDCPPKKRHTAVPPRPTATQTPTPTPVPTATIAAGALVIPPPAGGQGAPAGLPGGALGMIIVVCLLLGGVFLIGRRFMWDGSVKPPNPNTPGLDSFKPLGPPITPGRESPTKSGDDVSMHNNDDIAGDNFIKIDKQGK